MNISMIRHLVQKDWYFHRWTISFYVLVGFAGLATIRFGSSELAFYMGSIVLISALIGVGVHLIMATVVIERKEKNIPFVMSLPITAMDYTGAKIVANLSAFTVPWLTLLGGSLWLIAVSQSLPGGLAPLTAIVLGELAVAYCIMLATAIVSESEGWTILAIVLCNVGLNFFLYSVGNLPAITETMQGPVAHWNATVISILMAEALAIALIITATFALQARKRDSLS